LILGLCDRFHCLPSDLYTEGAEILRMIKIQQLGHPEKSEPQEVEEEGEEWPA